MVKIRHYGPVGPAIDEPALALFQRQWQLYRKVVDYNYLFHREAYNCLHLILVEEAENASPDGEDRDAWLRRWDDQKPCWTALAPEEWEAGQPTGQPMCMPTIFPRRTPVACAGP